LYVEEAKRKMFEHLSGD